MDFTLQTGLDDSFFYVRVATVTLAFDRKDIDGVIGHLEAIRAEIRQQEGLR